VLSRELRWVGVLIATSLDLLAMTVLLVLDRVQRL
jgi:hypothetical protein